MRTVDKLIIPSRFKNWIDQDFDAFKDMDALKIYVEHVKGATESYLRELLAEELNRQIVVPWGDKPGTKISVETALCQIVMEDVIHCGELSATLWQMNIDASYLGFWRYKLTHH